MTKHPVNRAERLKLKNTKDRRRKQIEEAIKRQEAEENELKNTASGDVYGTSTLGNRNSLTDVSI